MHRPHVGDAVRHRNGQPEVGPDLSGEGIEPRTFGCPMWSVEQCRPTAGEMLARRVVAQIRGEVRVHTSGHDLGEEPVTSAAGDRDRTDQTVWVAGRAYPYRSRGQTASGLLGEVRKSKRPRQLTDPTRVTWFGRQRSYVRAVRAARPARRIPRDVATSALVWAT